MGDGTLVVLGGASWDEYFEIDHWIELGDKAKMTILEPLVGGTTFNAAAVAAGLGLPTKIFEVMNKDAEDSRHILRGMEAVGLDTRYVAHHPDAVNSRALIVLVGGERGIFVTSQFRPRGSASPEWQGVANRASYLYTMVAFSGEFFDLLGFVGEAKAQGAKIVLDADAQYRSDTDFAMVRLADVPVFNSISYSRYSGLCGRDAAEVLLEGGADFVVETRDKNGCRVIERGGKVTDIPGYRVTVVDTTGAGDTFCGSLIYALHTGRAPADAAAFANACASRSVTVMGRGLCGPLEVERFMRETPRV